MPEYWEPGNDVQQKTVVPISRAMKIIRSLTIGCKHHNKKWSFHFQAAWEIQDCGFLCHGRRVVIPTLIQTS